MRLFIVACLSGMLFLAGCPKDDGGGAPTGDGANQMMEDAKAKGDAAAEEGKAAADDAEKAAEGLGKYIESHIDSFPVVLVRARGRQ